MDKHTLKAAKRNLSGRKVKQLRKEGILPANVYGKKIKSQAVQLPEKELLAVYAKAGQTGLVDLVVDGQSKPVLIHNIQLDPVTNRPLHADFMQVDLKEKVTAKVALETVGESQAVKDKQGVLLNILSEVEVEALPADLPEKIEVDVASLSAVDQVIKVSELKVSDKVKILTPGELEVIKVAPLVSKEAEKMAAEEAAAAAAAAAAQAAPAAGAGEGKEAATPAGAGATPASGGAAASGGQGQSKPSAASASAAGQQGKAS